jgi:hypothetical protein
MVAESPGVALFQKVEFAANDFWRWKKAEKDG